MSDVDAWLCLAVFLLLVEHLSFVRSVNRCLAEEHKKLVWLAAWCDKQVWQPRGSCDDDD